MWNEIDLGYLQVATNLSLLNPAIGFTHVPVNAPAGAELFFEIIDHNNNKAYSSGTLVTPGDLSCLDGSTQFGHTPVPAIPGTSLMTVFSNDSTRFQVDSGTWQSDISTAGTFETSSNSPGAKATFSFSGVGVSFYGIPGADRGFFNLILDGTTTYLIDQYAGNPSPFLLIQVLWSSPVLPDGPHTVEMVQIGPDARISKSGTVYPFLVSSEWGFAVVGDAGQPTVTTASPSSSGATSTFGSSTSPTSSSPTTATDSSNTGSEFPIKFDVPS